MLYELFVKGIIVLLLLNMILPPLLGIVDLLIRHTTRGEIKAGLIIKYQKLKCNNVCDTHDSLCYWTFIDFASGSMTVIILGALCDKSSPYSVGYSLFWAITVVLALYFIPRWVYDVCKGLKYKSKTGKLERIEALEREVERLKQEK